MLSRLAEAWHPLINVEEISAMTMLMMNKPRFAVLAFFLMVFAAQSAWAKTEFTAAQSCNAYTSTKKLTNPGSVKLEEGKSYTLLRPNRPNNPQWYLLKIDSAKPSERWVKVECGSKDGQATGGTSSTTGTSSNGSSCGTPAQADSYVFALSWQPAFCESKPNKPECAIRDPKVYQATHFTLHGLWPNKNSCGTKYGYCGQVKSQPSDFCQYPPVNLSSAVTDKLAVVMPSVGAHSCLERHEWHKHGTCQSGSADEYYTRATALVHEFNDSGMSKFISERINKKVSLNEIRAALDADLGVGTSKRAKIGCSKDGLLVDVWLYLPADLKPNASLKDLLAQGPNAPADNSCKNGFRVDEIGQ
jgi:ribonuclease T2